MTIVLAVIGSVVLIGIILLALWKLLVTIHDRREFDRFQSERSRARYEMVSLRWGCCWDVRRAAGMHWQQTALQGLGRVAGMRSVSASCALWWHGAELQVALPFPAGSYKYSAKLWPAFGFIMYSPEGLES